MILRELLEQHTCKVVFCGFCECGERKYDLITDNGLVYPPVEESLIMKINPKLLEESK